MPGLLLRGLGDKGQDVVGGDRTAVLVPHHSVPAHFAVVGVLAWLLIFAGELDSNGIPDLDRRQEPEVIDPEIRENRPRGGIHEQASGPGDDQVAVRDDPSEKRAGRCGDRIGVGVEVIAG